MLFPSRNASSRETRFGGMVIYSALMRIGFGRKVVLWLRLGGFSAGMTDSLHSRGMDHGLEKSA